ncbi:MAG: hypothetical protein ACFE9D_09100 [Promethearchaeota archaeon]
MASEVVVCGGLLLGSEVSGKAEGAACCGVGSTDLLKWGLKTAS